MKARKKVLILCTGNSCRSQMAEGWVNAELQGTWEARSAGTKPAGAIHPAAVQAMAEVGVDISTSRPQLVDAYLLDSWDLVITVCDSARETCPIFPQPVENLHISFPDPAEAEGSEDEIMEVFRKVRDAIRDSLLPEIRARSV
jgi:arsenate reductase